MSTSPDPGPTISPRTIVAAVLRRKLLFLAVFAAAVAAAAFAASRMPFRYESSFRLLVRPSARENFDPDRASVQGMPISDRVTLQTEFANAAAILQSQDLVARLARRLVEEGHAPRLDEGPEPRSGGSATPGNGVVDWVKELVLPPTYRAQEASGGELAGLVRDALSGAVVVSPVFGTTALDVKVTWSDPVSAHAIARRLVDVCREHYNDFYQSAESIEHVKRLVEETERKRHETIAKLTAIRMEANVTDIDRAIGEIDRQIGELEGRYTTCTVGIADASAQIRTVEDRLAKVPATLEPDVATVANPRYGALFGQLQALNLLKISGPAMRGESSQVDVAIEATRKELAKEEPFVQTRATADPNPVFVTLQQTLVTLNAQSAGLRDQCDTISTKLQELVARNRDLQQRKVEFDSLDLERAIIDSELTNQKLSLRAAEILLARDRVSSLQVLDRPRFAEAPTRNRRPLALLGGVFGGLVLAACCCVVLYRLRAEIHDVDDLRACTGVRVLGSVPACSRWGSPLRFRRAE